MNRIIAIAFSTLIAVSALSATSTSITRADPTPSKELKVPTKPGGPGNSGPGCAAGGTMQHDTYPLTAATGTARTCIAVDCNDAICGCVPVGQPPITCPGRKLCCGFGECGPCVPHG